MTFKAKNIRCGNCIYFGGINNKYEEKGECRKDSPTGAGAFSADWPLVHSKTGWCGGWVDDTSPNHEFIDHIFQFPI